MVSCAWHQSWIWSQPVCHTASAGMMNCGELGAGLSWLGLPLEESDLHALMRGLDKDGDGLLSLEEWSASMLHLAESDPVTQEQLAELMLQPLPVAELREGMAIVPPRAQPLSPAILAKFKFRLGPHSHLTPVWSSKDSLTREQLSIWALDIDATPLHKRSRARLSLGHYAVPGLDPPAKARVWQSLLEPKRPKVTPRSFCSLQLRPGACRRRKLSKSRI